MIKVECPSCQASYDLDERRIPTKGMKMRCPKCSASFFVHKSGETGDGAGPSSPPAPQTPPMPSPAASPGGGMPKRTMVGGAAPPPPDALKPSGPQSPPAQPQTSGVDQESSVARGPNLGGHTRPAGAFSGPMATLVGAASPLADTSDLSALKATGGPTSKAAAVPASPPPSQPPSQPQVAQAKAAAPGQGSKPGRPAPKSAADTPPSAGAFGSSAGAFGGASGAFGSGPPRKGTAMGLNAPSTAPGQKRGLSFGTGSTAAQETSDLPALKPNAGPPPPFSFSRSSDADGVDLPAPRKQPPAPPFPAGIGARASAPSPLAPPFEPRQAAPDVRAGAIAPPFEPKSAAIPMPPAPTATHSESHSEVDLPAFKASTGHAEFPKLEEEAGPGGNRGLNLTQSAGDDAEIELDLPTPKVAARADEFGEVELDLPAPKVAARADEFGEVELDLPAPRRDGAERAFPEADLPKPRSTRGNEFGEVELDLPTPRAPGPEGEPWELPAPRAQRGVAGEHPTDDDPFGALDLPALSEIEGGTREQDLLQPAFSDHEPQVDLPVARGNADLPALAQDNIDLPVARGNADLPALAQDNIDLPAPTGEMDLPGHVGETDLPVLQGFGDLDLMLPDEPGDRTSTSNASSSMPGAPFSDLDLPAPLPAAGLVTPKQRTVQGVGLPLDGESELPPSLMSDDETSFGDIDLGGGRSEPSPNLPEPPPSDSPLSHGLSMPPMAAGAVEDLTEEADFGEEDFDSEDEEDLYDEADEDMEFGIEEGDARSFSLPPEVLRRRNGEDLDAADAKKGKKALVVLGAAGVLTLIIGLGGVALGMFTQHGYFGVYYVEQFLPEAGSPEFARGEIERAEQQAASDTYADTRRALTMLGEARGKAGLNRQLLTRSLMHSAYFILRYGDSPETASHAAAIRRRLQERSDDAVGVELALAADLARQGQWQGAKALLQEAEKKTPADPYVHLLRGEIALAEGQGQVAETAFAQALQHNAGARAHFGLARAAHMAGDRETWARELEATLQESPHHEEALMDRARLKLSEGDWAGAKADLLYSVGHVPGVDKGYLHPARGAQAEGRALLGFIQEKSGQLHLARTAYDDALAADPTLLGALLGAGRVMLRERRFSEGLARFTAAANVADKEHDPVVLGGRHARAEAQLGMARALLALGRAPEARNTLTALATSLPEDHEVARALGDAHEQLNDPVQAEEQYRRAIALAPEVFDGYLSLSQLFARRGRADKASEILNEAAAKVEETSEMRRMLGLAELSRNHLRGAIHEFERALELEPNDLEARFGLGQSLRKGGQLNEARAEFDVIAKRDPAFAGLALERGMLHESAGDYATAIDTYKEALTKKPDDIDLLLRMGSTQVEAKRFDAAEQTLDQVLGRLPNSAQGEYLLGRVAFGRGRTPDALTHFDRALGLDGTQGEFHLYAARATLEMGNLGRALEESQIAIEREPSLGDAFWVRGVVRQRMGAVQDALRDFKHAIKLNPNRVDAYAGMGDCLDQMGELKAAIGAFRTALNSAPERGDWWYRLAQINQDMGARGEAERLISKAIEVGDQMARPPYWLADANRMAGDLARTSGNRQKATARYLRYLDVAPEGHVDRQTIQRQLQQWKVNWRKDDEY